MPASDRVEHDWMSHFASVDDFVCKRCGILQLNYETNTPSESTRVVTWYVKDKTTYALDPGCCERG